MSCLRKNKQPQASAWPKASWRMKGCGIKLPRALEATAPRVLRSSFHYISSSVDGGPERRKVLISLGGGRQGPPTSPPALMDGNQPGECPGRHGQPSAAVREDLSDTKHISEGHHPRSVQKKPTMPRATVNIFTRRLRGLSQPFRK